ncbi:MAG: hypothetical protein AAGB04_23560 [Pseudomonadota bacterium]
MAASASLNSNFTSYGMTAAAIVASDDLREDVLHARIMADNFRFADNENLKGLVSESTAGIITLGAVAQTLQTRKFAEQSEKLSKQRTQDAFFLALLRNGELDDWVGDQIANGMTLTDFDELDAQLLEETGMTFLQHAASILGPEAVQRLPDEDELEHRRRIMREVVPRVLDDGALRPEFQDNALARWVAKQEVTVLARERAVELDAFASEQGADAAIENASSDIASGYVQADRIGNAVQTSELAEASFNGVDAHSDNGFTESDTSTAKTAGFMAGFSGAGGALESASADFGNQFQTAAAEPVVGQQEPVPSNDPAVTLG